MAYPTLFLKAVVGPCVFMIFWSSVLAEPTVSTSLHTKKSNSSFLTFECETEARPPRMLFQLIDGTVVTIVNESKIVEYFMGMEKKTPKVTTKGMNHFRVSKEKFGWNYEEDYKCFIDILIGNFSFQSMFSRRVSSSTSLGDKPKDVINISPTYAIISEKDSMESSMTFRCHVNFELTKAVRWSIVRSGNTDDELLDDDLEEFHNTSMKISIESSMSESILKIDTVDLPPDKYVISCRSRSREDKDLSSASATFEITDVDHFSKYRKLVPLLGATSGFFFVVHLVTTFLLCYTCKKGREEEVSPTPSRPTRVVPNEVEQTHSPIQFNNSVTAEAEKDDYVNRLDSDDDQDDYVNQNQINHHTGTTANYFR